MYELILADCRHVLANMGDNTVDAICTDAPYHLTSIVKRFGGPNAAPQQFGTDGAFARASRGFMGQTWDGGDIAFDPELWAECLRVLKPGGYLLAFSGTRTYHRMAYAIDLAGFEIRDMTSWLYGSGFPKSHDFAAESKKGGERVLDSAFEGHPQAEGWGTAIKPACEPICMARKPLIGSVAANVLEWGTGGVNIDGCRIAGDDVPEGRTRNEGGVGTGQWLDLPDEFPPMPAGRFPANVVNDGSDDVLEHFPTLGRSNGGGGIKKGIGVPGQRTEGYLYDGPTGYGDSGSAARFFYCAKASKADRETGCAEAGLPFVLDANGNPTDRRNPHPTVKPTDLMRWLVRLVTPPGGLVFDPFTGSGSTGRAAILEGFRFLGAEMTPEYIPVARARIDAAVNSL